MNKPKLVLMVVANNDYQVQQAAAAKQAAQDCDVDLEVVETDHDAIKQSEVAFNLLYRSPETRPNGILFEPVGTPLAKAAEVAASSGVGWVILNREDVDYVREFRRRCSSPFFCITTDHDRVGHIQGEQIAALLPQGGKVFYIQGPSDNKAAVRRAAAMQSRKPANVEVRVLKGLWTEESAFAAVSSWLKLNGKKEVDFALVAAQNDAMVLGARRAFQELAGADRDRWLSLPFIGCDGLPNTGQAFVHRRILAATIVIPANAGQAVKTLAGALKTNHQPAECIFVDPHSYPDISALKPKH